MLGAHIVGNGRDAYCQQYVFPGLLATGRRPPLPVPVFHTPAAGRAVSATPAVSEVSNPTRLPSN